MRRSSDVFSHFLVGVFMLAVLALLGYFTIVISGVDILNGREKVRMTVLFPDVGGLKERDNVMYRGMKVGTVEEIALEKEGARVVLSVDDDVVMRETCKIRVASLSLLGGNYLLLEEGAGEERALVATVFEGERPVDWMRDLGRVAQNLGELTQDGGIKGIVTNAEAAAANIAAIAARLERGEGTLGKLLSADETVYNDLKATLADAARAAGKIAAVSERVERGEGLLGKILAADDGGVYADAQSALADLKVAMADAREALAELKTSLPDVKSALANVRAFTERLGDEQSLVGRLTGDHALAGNVQRLVENLDSFAANLARSEGTIGKLVNDPALYNDVSGLVKDLRQMVDNYRDTAPITAFGSLATGAL